LFLFTRLRQDAQTGTQKRREGENRLYSLISLMEREITLVMRKRKALQPPPSCLAQRVIRRLEALGG